ncbi:type IV pilin [Halorubrum sp. HHNYT27]|uniref:type IV pilin n=1 Tax=Halorubrum sp. HHNYT27 TaxID=3402275 RepID=UPI003EC059A6
MVAITVILAAVIGTFVLGLGDSLGDSQPTAQLNAEIDYTNGNITIEHAGGDSIESEELRVVVELNGTTVESNSTYANRLSVGDSITGSIVTGTTGTAANSEVRVRVIHSSSDSILLDRTFETTSELGSPNTSGFDLVAA